MTTSNSFVSKSNFLYLFFLLWLILNVIQATLTGVHPDEAYYWMYAKYLDWGYFDHPSMVAVLIKSFSWVSTNTLFLRLGGVIFNFIGVIFLWKILKQYNVNERIFALVFVSFLIFHIYSFIITPDTPLFTFTILYLYVYNKFVKEYAYKWALLLAVCCAALLYSKYHGILVILFTLLSNYKLLFKKQFYVVFLVSIVLYISHLYWQYVHNYPSIYYHLLDRTSDIYEFDFTLSFLLEQILIIGPLTGWLIWYLIFSKFKVKNELERAIIFIAFGTELFFLLSTKNGRVQVQWPLIAYICLFIFVNIQISRTPKSLQLLKRFKWLFAINIILIIMVRIILMLPLKPLANVKVVKDYHRWDIWAKQIANVAQNNYVIFFDSFQTPSFYNFYNNTTKAITYNTVNYRLNQYDLFPTQFEAQHKKVLLVFEFKPKQPYFEISTSKGIFYGSWFNDYFALPNIVIDPVTEIKENINTGAILKVDLKIIDNHQISLPSNYKIDENIFYVFKKNDDIVATEKAQLIKNKNQFTCLVKTPTKKGEYRLFFLIKTPNFAGTRNSKMIKIHVE